MTKRQLLELNHELFNNLEQVKSALEELRQENAQLKLKITELSEEIELSNSNRNQPLTQAESVKQENVSALKVEEPLKDVKEAQLPCDTNYAASVIGKIVMSAAIHCNSLGVLPENPNIKELINLVLGRTEVAKAEILNIISSNKDFETKKQLINNEKSSSEDYFRSVMAQL